MLIRAGPYQTYEVSGIIGERDEKIKVTLGKIQPSEMNHHDKRLQKYVSESHLDVRCSQYNHLRVLSNLLSYLVWPNDQIGLGQVS